MKKQDVQRGKYFWLTASLALIIIIIIISIPIRNYLSGLFIKTGDSYLLQKKFVSAEIEYNKAKILSNKYNPSSKIATVKNAETNILVIEDLLKQNHVQPELTKISEAKKIPVDEITGVKTAKKMIEDGYYPEAIICLKTTLEMDRTYKDAQLFLGIAYLNGARDAQVSKEGRASYQEKATEAFRRTLELDPGNETAKKYLAN